MRHLEFYYNYVDDEANWPPNISKTTDFNSRPEGFYFSMEGDDIEGEDIVDDFLYAGAHLCCFY